VIRSVTSLVEVRAFCLMTCRFRTHNLQGVDRRRSQLVLAVTCQAYSMYYGLMALVCMTFLKLYSSSKWMSLRQQT
jgi:hypothetical protein